MKIPQGVACVICNQCCDAEQETVHCYDARDGIGQYNGYSWHRECLENWNGKKGGVDKTTTLLNRLAQ